MNPSPEAASEDAVEAARDGDAPSMPDGLSASDLDAYIAHYPSWAQNLARKYFTKTLTLFVIHGNVRDLVHATDDDGSDKFVPVKDFLTNDLFAARELVLYYDRSSGITFGNDATQRDFNRALSGYDTIFGTDYAQRIPRDPARVFAVLENYFRLRLADGKRVAFIVDYAETLVPMAEASMYSPEDRAVLVFLQKWSHDPLFLKHDFTVCLLTENLTDLNRQLVQSPHTAEIFIPMPDENERKTFVRSNVGARQADFKQLADVSLDAVARNTAGLNFIQLRTIVADVLENRSRLTFERLSQLKKEFIEAEAYGLIEFIETDFTLDSVAGHTQAKQHLREASQAIRNGRPDVLPMGYLVSGPVGTGKTFLISCFAGEIGIPMVKLKNFRSQWQGVTEGNLEKILHLLEAMTPVAVMIDEADAALGNRDAQGDSGVSARVFAQIASFMSTPSHRGKVIFFLVTARPDLMPVDLKRQGRAEEHIALFYPSTREEREELLKVMMRRTGVSLDVSDVPEALLNGERTLSGADMEALLTRAKFRAATTTDDGKVSGSVLQEAVDDFIPPTYPLEVELQTLVAVIECTSRSLLPEQFRGMNREVVVRRVEELKRLVHDG